MIQSNIDIQLSDTKEDQILSFAKEELCHFLQNCSQYNELCSDKRIRTNR